MEHRQKTFVDFLIFNSPTSKPKRLELTAFDREVNDWVKENSDSTAEVLVTRHLSTNLMESDGLYVLVVTVIVEYIPKPEH
jgi:hypothetical protein